MHHVEVGATAVIAGESRPHGLRGVNGGQIELLYACMSHDRTDVVTQACALIAEGATTKAAAESLGLDASTLWRYVSSDQALRRMYADARVLQARAMADDVVNLADAATPENQAAVRLQMDARKWHASKTNPAEFGDKLQVDSRVEVGPTGDERLALLAQSLPALVLSLPSEQRSLLEANLKRLAAPIDDAIIIPDSDVTD